MGNKLTTRVEDTTEPLLDDIENPTQLVADVEDDPADVEDTREPLLDDIENPTQLVADVEDDPADVGDGLLAAELLGIELLAIAQNPTMTNDELFAVVQDLARTVESEAEVVERNIWKILSNLIKKLLFTPALPVHPEDDNQVLPLQDEESQLRRIYAEGIVPISFGLRFNINGPNDLVPIAKLVKERAELVKYIESIYKSGRDFRHNIILSLVGTILVGILNSIVDGLLADHISLGMRMIVLTIFNVAFMLYLGGAAYEMHSIYEPSLTEAILSHSFIIRSMNVHRNALTVEDSVPKKEGLSSEDERQLEYMLDDYCKQIIKPLPISQHKKASFIMLGCVVLSLIFAFILKALLLYGYPVPAPAPAPY